MRRYLEYSSKRVFSDLGAKSQGSDFFADAREEFDGIIYKDDIDYMLSEFTKENFLEKTKNGEIFTLCYRLRFGDSFQKVCLRAGLIEEQDGPQLVVGVFKVNE